MKNKNLGFTLLEVLLVIGIMAILAGIVIVAINPGKQLAATRNAERQSDLKQVRGAIEQYYLDHREYPVVLTEDLIEICNTNLSPAPDCSGLVDLSLLIPDYIVAIPVDPLGAEGNGTGYYISENTTSHELSLNAEQAEDGVTVAIGEGEESADPCEGVDIGEECVGGALYAGEYNGSKYMTTPEDGGQMAWSTEHILTSVVDEDNGQANTATLASLVGVYPAADYCAGLIYGSYQDWFLPSFNELNYVLYENKDDLGEFKTDAPTPDSLSLYWSSTENEEGMVGWNALGQSFFDGSRDGFLGKTSVWYIRCVRSY